MVEKICPGRNNECTGLHHFPEKNPQWDPHVARGFQMLECYQEAFLSGMKEGEKRAINMNKTSEVLQGSEERPSQFYGKLCEVLCFYTPFDPEATENQLMVNAAFVSEAQGDI